MKTKEYRLSIIPTGALFNDLAKEVGCDPDELKRLELIFTAKPEAKEDSRDKLILAATREVGKSLLSVKWEVGYEEE
ncbi:hypothetical protein [uncultured Porphyromonas sp.]|uniref:hypothetical protein n=1 Tax=uncultured Porphyromonas sp. TaxID=159274 RepID=UPI002593B36A|nr:hypothetical protein [uncultured Porphyromonas sp.]